MREKINESKKEPLKIQGFTITTLLAYFIIYSIIGFIIETIFGILTKGVLESRKSFIIGPFCSIYGLGAVIMILALQKFKKNNYTLFFGGFLVGSIIEYVVSLIGEAIFHVVWWDYSDMAFNINGRIIFIQTIEKSCYNYYDIFDDRYGNYRNWAKGIFCKTCKRK